MLFSDGMGARKSTCRPMWGVFTNENYFVPRLQAMAMEETLPFRFKTPALPPIGGAVIAALQQINVQFSSSFVETFQKNYV